AAGRILIDTATPEADPATWANTEEMVLVWLDQMLGELGYQVTPTPAGGRSPLPAREAGWH
ncbi:MAG: hypothetical protein ACREPA_01285, partial [Candidatus Dormibacteraceae bacterium]